MQLDAGEYLLEAMVDMGPYVATAFGLATRPDSEITAYFTGMGIPLEPWEFATIRKMCRAYLAGRMSSQDVFSIPPMDRASATPPEYPSGS